MMQALCRRVAAAVLPVARVAMGRAAAVRVGIHPMRMIPMRATLECRKLGSNPMRRAVLQAAGVMVDSIRATATATANRTKGVVAKIATTTIAACTPGRKNFSTKKVKRWISTTTAVAILNASIQRR